MRRDPVPLIVQALLESEITPEHIRKIIMFLREVSKQGPAPFWTDFNPERCTVATFQKLEEISVNCERTFDALVSAAKALMLEVQITNTILFDRTLVNKATAIVAGGEIRVLENPKINTSFTTIEPRHPVKKEPRAFIRERNGIVVESEKWENGFVILENGRVTAQDCGMHGYYHVVWSSTTPSIPITVLAANREDYGFGKEIKAWAKVKAMTTFAEL